MGRCAGVVLVVALMCACVGAAAAAKKECKVRDVLVGSGGPSGLCVAWLPTSLATVPPDQRPGQFNRVFYNVTVWKADPPYRGPPPNTYGQYGAPIGRIDSDVECDRVSPGSLAYETLEKLGKKEGGLYGPTNRPDDYCITTLPGFILEEDSDLYHFASVNPEYCGPDYDPTQKMTGSRNSAPRDRPRQGDTERWPLQEGCWFYPAFLPEYYNSTAGAGGGGNNSKLRS